MPAFLQSRLLVLLPLFTVCGAVAQSSDLPPIADAHVHYSHDSVELTPPERVIELMREANLKFALVSSSDDRGTQLLTDLAPDLIVPGLRPYTRRGQTSSWYTNEDNLLYVESLLEKNRYASIGEFHLFGKTADLPIPRRIVELADQHNLILHAHSDADAVERLLAQSPTVKIIWAHSGFDEPAAIAQMLEKHDRLWADLAFRSDVGSGRSLSKDWIELFTSYPDRMMLGTDTYTPERMYFITSHADNARAWLASLPMDVAEQVAWKNAHDLIMPVWETNRQSIAHAQGMQRVGIESGEVNCDYSDADYQLQSDQYSVSIEPLGDIVVSEPFPVSLTVCGAAAAEATVTLDATMPAHGHGMNYTPTHKVLARNANGQQIQVEGLVLHMPGRWQWSVDVRANEARNTLTQEFEVQ